MANDAVLYSDGGGKARAAPGTDPRCRQDRSLLPGNQQKAPPGVSVRRVRVNGQPGLITTVDGQLVLVLTLDVVDGRIASCFVVRNPDKLARVAIA